MPNSARIDSIHSRMALSGFSRCTPTRAAIGSHQAPSPSMTRPCPSTLPPSSHIVDQVAAMTAGLRVQIGSTPDPKRMRRVLARKALIMTMQSRARRVSACQISLKPRSSA
jgi:hypothetical protein